MNFNDHSVLEGQHAFLSASKYQWVNYEPEKIEHAYSKVLAAQKGTILHKYAADSINLKQKLANLKLSLNAYVNDAIGYRMTPEQILWYSNNAFGTVDAISFRDEKLRIHDLKTGSSPVSIKQLEIYAALFCLEYHQQPKNIDMELRIYQSSEIIVHIPEWRSVYDIMQKIIAYDKIIVRLKSESED